MSDVAVTPLGPSSVTGPGTGGSSAPAFLALLLIAVELVLGAFSSDIARWGYDLPVLGGHLRILQWGILMLPFLPLALVAGLLARTRRRASAAVVAALVAGLFAIGFYELILFLFTHGHSPGVQVDRALGYVDVMIVAVLATLAWSVARREGRWWLFGPVVAAAGAALTVRTNWPSHLGWTSFSDPFTATQVRESFLVQTAAALVPVVLGCLAAWLLERREHGAA